MSHLHQDKKILNRVKRIQGQINAVEQSLNTLKIGRAHV